MLRLLLIASLAAALAACGSPEPVVDPSPVNPNPTNPAPELATCPSEIVIKDFEYLPDDCQVAAGTMLTFVNEDTVQHTATSRPATPVAFDTGNINPNESATVTFTKAGVYNYYCTIHPDMEASITVK